MDIAQSYRVNRDTVMTSFNTCVITTSNTIHVWCINLLGEHPSTLLHICHPQLETVSTVEGVPDIACRPSIH